MKNHFCHKSFLSSSSSFEFLSIFFLILTKCNLFSWWGMPSRCSACVCLRHFFLRRPNYAICCGINYFVCYQLTYFYSFQIQFFFPFQRVLSYRLLLCGEKLKTVCLWYWVCFVWFQRKNKDKFHTADRQCRNARQNENKTFIQRTFFWWHFEK